LAEAAECLSFSLERINVSSFGVVAEDHSIRLEKEFLNEISSVFRCREKIFHVFAGDKLELLVSVVNQVAFGVSSILELRILFINSLRNQFF